jgi:hypothetical protein
MDSDNLAKKRPVDILIYKNWRKWFKLIELYFAGEELDFVLYQTEEEYCTVARFTTTDINIPVTDCNDIDKVRKLLKGLNIGKRKTGKMNIEKQRLY